MKKSPTELLAAPWIKESEYRFLHRSGAFIERRGYPFQAGWYLVADEKGLVQHRFSPTPQGCDEAFIAFSGRGNV